MIKACIFDLDGVIVDTAVYHYQAWKRLAAELGFDFSEADNERLKGVSRVRSLQIILEIGGITKTEAEQEQLATRKNQWYVEMITRMTPAEILPGALPFLQSCHQHGIKVALGSASKNAATILDKTGLAPYFDAIIDGNQVVNGKPTPEVFLKGADALGLNPGQCVVFEDAEAGVEAAIAAGMKVVGIGSPGLLGAANMVIDGLHQMDVRLLAVL